MRYSCQSVARCVWLRGGGEVSAQDQRGTGRSTPVTTSSVLARGDARQQAAYLQNFRAESIVRDVVNPLCQIPTWKVVGEVRRVRMFNVEGIGGLSERRFLCLSTNCKKLVVRRYR